jgi:hypothetical protein
MLPEVKPKRGIEKILSMRKFLCGAIVALVLFIAGMATRPTPQVTAQAALPPVVYAPTVQELISEVDPQDWPVGRTVRVLQNATPRVKVRRLMVFMEGPSSAPLMEGEKFRLQFKDGSRSSTKEVLSTELRTRPTPDSIGLAANNTMHMVEFGPYEVFTKPIARIEKVAE